MNLNDFQEENNTNQVTLTTSPRLLEMLQKDGYAKNLKTGTTSSKVEISTFKAKVTIWKYPVLVSFDGNEINDKIAFISVINEKLDWLNMHKELVDKKIIESLLELKNTTWLDENENPISSSKFTSKIRMKTISFYENNSFDLEFDDSNLFGGHSITVVINNSLNIEDVNI